MGPGWKPEEGALGNVLKERNIKIEGERKALQVTKIARTRNRGQGDDVITGYNTGFFLRFVFLKDPSRVQTSSW